MLPPSASYRHKPTFGDLTAESVALKAAVAAMTLPSQPPRSGLWRSSPARPSDKRQFVDWRVGGISPSPPAAAELSFVPQVGRASCAAVGLAEGRR
jgi:hypothetical protein